MGTLCWEHPQGLSSDMLVVMEIVVMKMMMKMMVDMVAKVGVVTAVTTLEMKTVVVNVTFCLWMD